jgi:hypothetical protein
MKPERLVGWTPNEKVKLFRRDCFFPVDLAGLIGVRPHQRVYPKQILANQNAHKSTSSALARRMKPARARPDLTAEIFRI